jgi:hypothetical protein
MRRKQARNGIMLMQQSGEEASMFRSKGWRSLGIAAGMVTLVLLSAPPAEAQVDYKHDYQPLFDKFNLRLEGSWLAMTTEIRLDSEALGRGTTLKFEDDLNLDSSKIIPSLAFEWQIGKRHRLGLRWQDITRDSTAQALTEIQWGDETIPIDANIALGFDVTQYYLDWTYYPWVKEKWAAGFGLGLRILELSATLSWDLEGDGGGDSATSDVKGTGPLPYLYFEYRRLFGDHWRLLTGLGWLYVSVEDISGGQWIGRVGGEYLLGKHWGFGAAINLAFIDVDWDAIEDDELGSVLNMSLQYDINDFSVYVRFRF